MIKTRRGYTAFLWLLLPGVFIRLLWRARRQAAYLKHIPERFGFYAHRPDRPVIWLHAVSVGETRAAAPLVEALQREHPSSRILLTHMTPTGRETGENVYGERVLRCYLPYDYPFAVRRFLNHFAPRVGVLMETEIWFNLIHACKTRVVPLFLVNARLSEKSAARYARFAALTRDSLRELTRIAAQTPDDARRLEGLGAVDVHVCGNLKFDIDAPSEMLSRGRQWRAQFGERSVLLAASTRDGEEALLLDALTCVPPPQPSPAGGEGAHQNIARDLHDLLLVIVPRHPQRFDEVARMLESRRIAFERRSETSALKPETRVLLGDSMGEMFAYYAACDIAFIGGSLLPFGGQNLIEACACGAPVIIGPHTYNFSEAAAAAIEAGAALRVHDADELFAAAKSLLADETRLSAMREAGRKFVARHRGATEKLMELIRW